MMKSVLLKLNNPNTDSNYKELTDFQVNITLQRLSGINLDFTNIAFETLAGQRIPHFVESYDSTSASIWVRVPLIGATGATIRLLIGVNQNLSNADETFMLYDEFYGDSLDDKWSVDPEANVSFPESGIVQINIPSMAWAGYFGIYTSIPVRNNVVYEARGNLEEWTTSKLHGFNYLLLTDSGTEVAKVGNRDAWGTSGLSVLEAMVEAAGWSTDIGYYFGWHDYKIIKEGNLYTLFIDGVQRYSANSTLSPNIVELPNGRYEYDSPISQYDYIKIRAYAPLAPTLETILPSSKPKIYLFATGETVTTNNLTKSVETALKDTRTKTINIDTGLLDSVTKNVPVSASVKTSRSLTKSIEATTVIPTSVIKPIKTKLIGTREKQVDIDTKLRVINFVSKTINTHLVSPKVVEKSVEAKITGSATKSVDVSTALLETFSKDYVIRSFVQKSYSNNYEVTSKLKSITTKDIPVNSKLEGYVIKNVNIESAVKTFREKTVEVTGSVITERSKSLPIEVTLTKGRENLKQELSYIGYDFIPSRYECSAFYAFDVTVKRYSELFGYQETSFTITDCYLETWENDTATRVSDGYIDGSQIGFSAPIYPGVYYLVIEVMSGIMPGLHRQKIRAGLAVKEG